MSEAARPVIEAAAAQALTQGAAHYLDAVSALAAQHEVRAATDIVAANGIKLVARGARVDETLREKLAGHRLGGLTLEESLMIADGVTPESLAADLAALIDGDAWLARLARRSGDEGGMRRGLSRLQLSREILFRLSVVRDQRPVLYRHLLAVSAVSHYLALRAGEAEALADGVQLAALCHDLGEMHTDPAILEPGHVVTAEERRFIYVHPITGWMIVRKLPGVDAEVARAVLQHHERLDGSGYPYGRKDADICPAARILAVADVADAITARFADDRRLSTLLRLNFRKYDRRYIDALHDALAAEGPGVMHFERDGLARKLRAIAAVLDDWTRLRGATALAESVPGEFLAERMFNLRSVVLQAGFDPDSLDMPLQLAEEDPEIAAELTNVCEELSFQLAELGHEMDRRAPEWAAQVDAVSAQALAGWRRTLAACIA